ncbi:rod shape-determining protein MreD [Natronospira bacteriovora]|uniref:Rod shape-determining protein MreD n=1 Tax=Natronospira bacteriovora TaxID=3069753 RepID=A0ABU0W412_9GAMM|nr:rod shape-determining protein MreD [Natronospira sp. AB-CW4]MDQ2068757.1 rod shape-determining protein MreD [Natronospira sp. AB-CW4]
MTDAPAQGRSVVFASLLMALMLTIWPLPEAIAPFRPDWSALFLIYWIMALPHRFNVGTAWCVGLILDVLTGSLLGQHAIALAITGVLVAMSHLRVRVFPVWQQAMTVMVLLAVNELILILVEGATGQLYDLEWRWAPIVTGMLFWPWVLFFLRSLRRRFDVS